MCSFGFGKSFILSSRSNLWAETPPVIVQDPILITCHNETEKCIIFCCTKRSRKHSSKRQFSLRLCGTHLLSILFSQPFSAGWWQFYTYSKFSSKLDCCARISCNYYFHFLNVNNKNVSSPRFIFKSHFHPIISLIKVNCAFIYHSLLKKNSVKLLRIYW